MYKYLLVAILAVTMTSTNGGYISTPIAMAKQCKSAPVCAHGQKKFRIKRAKKRARQAWRGKVQAQIGSPWGNWLLSSNKNVSCNKSGARWRCDACAVPCRIGGSGGGSGGGSSTTCHAATISATGSKKLSKKKAKQKATLAWISKVQSQLNPTWANWGKAKNKSRPCKKSGGRWKCTAKAKPCK